MADQAACPHPSQQLWEARFSGPATGHSIGLDCLAQGTVDRSLGGRNGSFFFLFSLCGSGDGPVKARFWDVPGLVVPW